MFKKINLDLRGIDIERIKGPFFEAYGEQFIQYAIKDPDYFNDLLSKQIKFGIPPVLNCYTEVSGTDGAGQTGHTDACMTALNYYIVTSNCITLFWRSVQPEKRMVIPQIRGINDTESVTTYSYDPCDLTYVSSFVARDHEAYLLDTHQIHSIKKPILSPNRVFIRWLWYVPYEEVLSSIEIL